MLTQKKLKEILSYDPESGVFTRIKTGKVAGSLRSDGYIHLRVGKKLYFAHRLAWLYVHGYFPENQIDHLNGIRNDNRLENLREVSQACNTQNCKISSRNTSGFPGVNRHKQRKKWQARGMLQQKHVYLGLYPSPLDAALARFTWEVQCSNWTCNHRSELVKAIKEAWPGFNTKGG